MPETIGADVRDGLIAMAGFSTFPLLDVLEKYGANYFLKRAGVDVKDLSPNSQKDGQ